MTDLRIKQYLIMIQQLISYSPEIELKREHVFLCKQSRILGTLTLLILKFIMKMCFEHLIGV